MHGGGRVIGTHPVNGETAAGGNGHTLGFLAPSTDAVDAWHAAGVANGGTTAEDPPGVRHATEGRTVYLAYLRDPAGNKLCATHKISGRSEEHTSELQSLMRISYAVFCLKKKTSTQYKI